MKKRISIVLLVALCLSLFSGCNLIPQIQPDDSNLERAKALVFNAYKPAKKDEVPVKSADFEVMTSVLVDGETFPVSWTVEVTAGPADAVQIVDGSSDAFKKVDLTEKPDEEVLFTLTATLSDSEGNTASVSFNFKTLKYEAPTADKVVIKLPKDGSYTTGTEYLYTDKNKMELVLSATKAEAIAFTMIENADNTVTFKTDDNYYLFCDATSVEFATAESDYTKFVLEATDGGYFIKCAVANYNGKAQYLEVYKGYLTCYGMGDDLTIYTFELENADGAAGTVKKFSETTDPTDPTDPSAPTDPTPAEPAYVTNPEVGATYKLGLYQTNKSAIYYFTGAMSGYYGATETDKATAVDVTLEDAGDGKFHICFTVGDTKNYIYGEASGTHLNFKFGETKGVFTWDAENSTFTTVIGETTVFMGTYSNYVTFGMSDIAKIGTSYAAHLYN